MIILIVILALLSAVISIPAWNQCIRQEKFFWWDYGITVYPLLLWLLLVYFRVGAQSLANVVELVAISIGVVIVGYLRAYLFNKVMSSAYQISMISIGLLFLLTIVLRLAMPRIPE